MLTMTSWPIQHHDRYDGEVSVQNHTIFYFSLFDSGQDECHTEK